jgi:hypothetical protein
MARTSLLTMRSDETVWCPIRGDVTIEICGNCPLLISIKAKRGGTRVRCRPPGDPRCDGHRSTIGMWMNTRAGTGGRSYQ